MCHPPYHPQYSWLRKRHMAWVEDNARAAGVRAPTTNTSTIKAEGGAAGTPAGGRLRAKGAAPEYEGLPLKRARKRRTMASELYRGVHQDVTGGAHHGRWFARQAVPGPVGYGRPPGQTTTLVGVQGGAGGVG